MKKKKIIEIVNSNRNIINMHYLLNYYVRLKYVYNIFYNNRTRSVLRMSKYKRL